MKYESPETEDEKPRYLLPDGCSDLIDALSRDTELRAKSDEDEDAVEF